MLEHLNHDLLLWIQSEGLHSRIPPQRMDDKIFVGRFNEKMLKILKCKDLALVTSISVLEKMIFDHGISPRKLADLLYLVCNPLQIFNSASHPDRSVVVVSFEFVGNKPLLVAIHLEKTGAAGKSPNHWIASAYGKDKPEQLNIWKRDNLLIWEC